MVRIEVTFVGDKLVTFPHVDETMIERRDNMIILGKVEDHEACINFDNVLYFEVREE